MKITKMYWEWCDAGDCQECGMDYASWIVEDNGKHICSVCADKLREVTA